MTNSKGSRLQGTDTAARSLRRSGDQTRERILDAAEMLFAMQGYHGTSMRDVAAAADSRVALVTHHFETKDLLFSRVVERKSFYLNSRRIDLLDRAGHDAQGNCIPVRALIEAFVWPYLERWSEGGTGWKHYTELIAKLANSSQREIITRYYDAVARRYLVEFEKTLADYDRAGIYYGFNFMVGMSLTVVSQPDRVHKLSLGTVRIDDIGSISRMMVDFIEFGFRSIPLAPAIGT